jgi:predicted transcriptional regulator
MNKKTVQTTINQLPEEFTLDELVERLIFVNKIERGLKDSEEGRVISHEEVKKRFKK